ncbi:piercer of microtubule wall 1 protein-like [Osmerus mordax]|uniref:piercer of microtubule wall 1 protein-like n=1 Tax=Osmerus mordax TaxID=8014 RepID=UPI0035106FC5
MDTENDVESHPITPEETRKTSDVYRVNPNLPTRFNNPDCFHGYSKKTIHPLYQTSNQIYGSKRPTVHEMPTRFHGALRKFSDHMQKSGMFRDNGFNTSPEKSRVVGPDNVAIFHDRLNFQHCFKNQATGPAV